MNTLKSSFAAITLTVACAATHAAYIDFAAMANGATGESAWNPLTLTYADFGVSITATNGTAGAFAYLDRNTGGLGVCKALNTAGTVALNKATNSGANLCLSSSDDNVTTAEALNFVFTKDVIIETIWFNNNHDVDYSLLNDHIRIGGVATQLLTEAAAPGGKWSWTTTPYFVAAGSSFGIAHIDEEFYVHKMSIRAVPEPGSLALLGLGLFGLAAARRRR